MRSIHLLLIMVVSLILVVSACSGSTPAAVPTVSSAPVLVTPVQSSGDVIKLKFSEGNPENSAVGQVHKRWAERIEKNSNGRIAMEMYFSGALASQAERLRSTQTGIADISYYSIGTDRNLMPLSLVTALPFAGLPADMAKTTRIWWQLYDEFPEIQKEWESIKLINGASMAATQLHLTKKDARLPADISGLKLISKGEQPLTLKAMGASPMDLQIGDWYTSLERGLAEGIMNHFPVIYVFKILDIVPHHTIFGSEGATMDMALFIMNKDTWNKLPPDLQDVIIEAGKWQDEEIIKDDNLQIQIGIDAAKAANHSFTNLNEEELAAWRDAAKPAHEQWIAEFESKGLPSREVYNRMLQIIQENK